MAIHIFMMLSYLEIMKDGLHRPKGNQSTYKKKVWYLHPLLFIYALFLVFFFLHKITKFHFSEKSITLVRLVLQRELIFTHLFFFFSLQWEMNFTLSFLMNVFYSLSFSATFMHNFFTKRKKLNAFIRNGCVKIIPFCNFTWTSTKKLR